MGRNRLFAVVLLAIGLAVGLALAPPAQASLVEWYTFDASNINDSSPNANNGSIWGTGSGVTFSGDVPPIYAAGPTQRSLDTTAPVGQQRITVPTSPSLYSIKDAFTVSYWMKASNTQSDWGRLLQHGEGGGNESGWMVNRYGNQNNVNVRVDTSGTYNQNQAVGGTAAPYDSTWHYMAFVFSGGNWRKYNWDAVNGLQTTTGTYNHGTGFQNNRDLAIASQLGADIQYKGLLDDVAIWNQPLSASDIANLASGAWTPLNVPNREVVSYRISVGSAGSATINGAYTAPNLSSLGTQFQTSVSAAGTATATGAVGVGVGFTDYIQIDASGIVGAGNPPAAPWMAAVFTAPMNYTFTQTGNQYLTTQSSGAPGWRDSLGQWGTVGGGQGDATMYQVTSPNPAMGGGFPSGTQALWGGDAEGITQTRAFFDVPASLQPGTWSVFGAQPNPAQPQGLSAHIVRVDNNLDNLGLVDTALTRQPNQANHSVSQVTTIPRADLDSAGAFSNPAGYLPGDQHSAGASPEDYAVRLAGYIYATAGSARSFAISGDNRFYFTVGGTEFTRTEGAVAGGTPLIATMQFTATGYYPVELVYGNRDSTAGLEISTAAPTWDGTKWVAPAFNTTTYQLLGTDVGYPVYQRPSGVPAPSSAGANTVGGLVYAGSVTGASSGLRVQQAYPAAAPTSVDSAISYFADKTVQNGSLTNYNVGVFENRTNLGMNDPGWAAPGNFTDQPFPINNRDATYAVVANKNDDNFVTRINGLVYIAAAGTYAVTNSSNEGFQLRIGNQQFGRRAGAGDTPAGTANYMYGYFPQAGLYPFEYYQYEATANSNLELAHGGTTSLILTTNSRNPVTNGFTADWAASGTQVYAVEPRAMLKAESTTLQVQAFGSVPALVGDPTLQGIVAPERWKLERYSIANQGLFGQKYNYSGNTGAAWDETRPLIASQVFFGIGGTYPNFSIPAGQGFGFTGNLQGDQIGARYTGYLKVPTTGAYNFQMNTDDVSWIFIDIDGDWDIPGPGYQVFEAGEAAPGNQAWTVNWNGVSLNAGNHYVEFRSREYGGGEWNNVYWSGPGIAWQYIDGSYFQVPAGQEYIAWILLAQGASTVGDLVNYSNLMTFDFNSTYTLRLSTEIAGLTAMYQATFLFVPEPGTMLLLAGGLIAVAARRRRSRR